MGAGAEITGGAAITGTGVDVGLVGTRTGAAGAGAWIIGAGVGITGAGAAIGNNTTVDTGVGIAVGKNAGRTAVAEVTPTAIGVSTIPSASSTSVLVTIFGGAPGTSILNHNCKS